MYKDITEKFKRIKMGRQICNTKQLREMQIIKLVLKVKPKKIKIQIRVEEKINKT